MHITFEQLPQAIGLLHEKLDRISELVQQNNKQQDPADTDELLTIQQAATFLKLSVQTLYGFTHHAKIPFCKKDSDCIFLNLN